MPNRAMARREGMGVFLRVTLCPRIAVPIAAIGEEAAPSDTNWIHYEFSWTN